MALFAVAGSMLAPLPAAAQGKYVVKPVAEMRIKQLPKGPLYWRVENFPSLDQAKAAAGTYRWNPDTVSYDGSPSLAAEVAGKVWLFTLGAKGGATPGGKKVAEIGPLPPIAAPEYLLRVNHGSGAPASRTSTHTHPGSEAFYVVAGRLGQKTPSGERHVEAGGTMNGHAADTPMQVFNSGTADLTALIMFVVDGSKAFSVPAKLPQDEAKAGSGKASVKVLFDDDRIRAFEVTYRPGDQSNTSYKRLPFRIVRAMSSGTLQRTYPDGKTEKVDIVAGEVRVFDTGNQYSGRNIGTSVLVFYGVTPKLPKKKM